MTKTAEVTWLRKLLGVVSGTTGARVRAAAPAPPTEDLVAAEPVVGGRRVYLFLDFDGVMDDGLGQHPFFHAHQVDQLLRRFPSVRVVLTTSARHYASLEELAQPFAADVRSHIIDVTPSARVLGVGGELGERQLECEAWLQLNNAEGAPWLAADDMEAYYRPRCEQLCLVGQAGLDKDCAERLAERLEALISGYTLR
jgi:HAD domain in Swiss Army Knife RNA repair proteins